MTNVELIVQMLAQAGVRHVFGVPSGPVLALIDALRRARDVDWVLTASETSAGFMAEATGRITGVPGVCVSTVGPGATNLATGVGGAYLDRSPMLAITCTFPRQQLGRRTQMLIDHQALFAPITKASYALEPGRIVETVTRALTEATTEPPGPVHLELPEDVGWAEAAEMPILVRPTAPAGQAPKSFARGVGAALEKARRPLVLTGSGFTRASNRDALLRFIDTQGIPFVTTLHAKGFLPESRSGSLGVVGRARRTDVQRMIDSADLLLAVGFDPVEIDYEDFATRVPVVHIDREGVQPGTKVEITGQFNGGLDAMLEVLSEMPPIDNDWSPAEWQAHRTTLGMALRPASHAMATHHVLDVLRQRLPADAILTYDVGAHTHQIATQWQTDLPHTALATNGWSSMGYGMPAAYAAKLAHPARTVVAVIGDGGFHMTVGELAAARRLGLRVPVIVLSDGWLGLMKVKQERLELPVTSSVLGQPVDPPAHYFGVPARGARDEQELSDALEWALALDGPSVIEAFVDAEPYSMSVFDES